MNHGDPVKTNKSYKFIVISLALFLVLACNALIPTPTVTPSPLPLTSTPAVSISQQVTLVSLPYAETYQDPHFSIMVQIPRLQGIDEPRVQTLNKILNE